jgi:hypothetical protein
LAVIAPKPGRQLRFYGIADAEQLAILSTVLDEYCADNAIDRRSNRRDKVALILVAAFKSGACSSKELRARLDASAYRNDGELRRTG